MRKPILNSFLGCATLETGGKIVGWITVIFGALGLFGSVLIAIASAYGLGELTGTESDYEDLKFVFTVALVMYSIFSVYLVFVIIAGVFLLNGVKRRLHGKILPMVILLGIGAVLDLLGIFANNSVAGIILSLIIAAIAVYIFLVILSLYQKIKMENEQGNFGNSGGIVYNPGQAQGTVPQNTTKNYY